MFYSKEILTLSNDDVNLHRLAATLGSSSKFRKLSKKEVNSVDLVKACKFVSSPPEPLALRLTSNLMVGITRVYNQQYHFYYTDVGVVYSRLHRAFKELQNESVDMPVPQARLESITLEDDPYFEIEMSILTGSQENVMVPDIEWALDWAQPLSPTGQVPMDESTRASNATSRRSLITIPDIADQSFSASTTGFSGGLMEDDLLMVDDSGIRIDFDEEGGLFEFMEGQGTDAGETPQPRNRDAANRDTDEIVRRVREEHENAGRAAEEREKRKRQRREALKEIEREMELEFQQDVEMNFEEEQNDHVVPMQPTSEELILEMRERVKDDLIEGERINREKSLMHEYKNRWQQILYTPVLPICAPQIASLWNNHCAPMLQDDAFRKRRLSPTLELRQNDDIAELDDLYIDDIGIESSRQPNQTRKKDNSLQDVELERLRRGGSQSSSVIIPQGLQNVETEAADVTMDFDIDSSVGTASRDILDINLLSALGSADRQRRQSSIGINRQSIGLSDLFDENSVGIPDFPIFEELGELESLSIDKENRREAGSAQNSEQEQMNFLESMKNLMLEAQISRVVFQDIIEMQHLSRSEVAKAFYNVLGLATKNLIKTRQLQPYENILIEIE
ncbi:17745_t:CDS:10 [Acaulospora morrowiae]|uniref:17745_t:CDS:1 n=1 Tax=Acaulospora morrowiae TaxID=94023 RepID=A0A9N9C0K7_9GLOM|nr:17745_t:CDS:10 [Acaulospora morrowiae]